MPQIDLLEDGLGAQLLQLEQLGSVAAEVHLARQRLQQVAALHQFQLHEGGAVVAGH